MQIWPTPVIFFVIELSVPYLCHIKGNMIAVRYRTVAGISWKSFCNYQLTVCTALWLCVSRLFEDKPWGLYVIYKKKRGNFWSWSNQYTPTLSSKQTHANAIRSSSSPLGLHWAHWCQELLLHTVISDFFPSSSTGLSQLQLKHDGLRDDHDRGDTMRCTRCNWVAGWSEEPVASVFTGRKREICYDSTQWRKSMTELRDKEEINVYERLGAFWKRVNICIL